MTESVARHETRLSGHLGTPNAHAARLAGSSWPARLSTTNVNDNTMLINVSKTTVLENA